MACPKVLIGGGTGFIGKHLGALLRASSYNVTAISRMPAANNISWTDLTEGGLPSHTSAVVNLAGQPLMDFSKSWSPGFKQNIFNSRVVTTKTIAELINTSKHKPKVFVLVTGVGAYEPSECNKYDEQSPIKGTDFFSQLCIEWEKAALVDPPVRLVIIRSGAVLGRNGGMIQNMFLPFFLGVGGRIGSGKQFLPWIHVQDMARLIKFAIEHEEVKGVLNGVAPQIITNEEFTKAFAKALCRPAFIPVPEFVLDTLLNPERAMIMTKGQHVTPRRVLEYGFEYQYGAIEEACKEVAHLFPKKVEDSISTAKH